MLNVYFDNISVLSLRFILDCSKSLNLTGPADRLKLHSRNFCTGSAIQLTNTKNAITYHNTLCWSLQSLA